MSVTGGESSPNYLGKERKRPSRVFILAMVLVAVLIVGATAWLTVQVVSHPSKYAKHSPISIVTNWEFTHANGVVGGSGTASDPYIIADWDIDASSANGISIQDTDAHFTVRNCYVHDGSTSWLGIYLVMCSNGTLSNNDCSNNLNGITLEGHSSNNMVVNNTCSSNSHDGIALGGSNNVISGNNCSSNGYDGIYLYWSDNNTLSDNTCNSNSHDGMHLDISSNNNEISWNLVRSSAIYGLNISGANNRIWDNIIIGNNGATDTYHSPNAQARDDGTNNWWNGTDVLGRIEGNYWSDWLTPDAIPPWNIVDNPYIILGSAGAKDYYPLPYNPLHIGISFIPSCLS
jgi:parallel beta-helix repeat protein